MVKEPGEKLEEDAELACAIGGSGGGGGKGAVDEATTGASLLLSLGGGGGVRWPFCWLALMLLLLFFV